MQFKEFWVCMGSDGMVLTNAGLRSEKIVPPSIKDSATVYYCTYESVKMFQRL